MKMKYIFAAAPLFLAVSAQAAPIVLDLTGGSASFSSAEASQEYQFSLASDSIGDGTITATFGPRSGYEITSVLFNGQPVTPDLNTNRFSNFTLFQGPLAAGDYTFSVLGVSNGGEYTGRIDVTAVPEASTIAYLMAGLSVATFVTRRRTPR